MYVCMYIYIYIYTHKHIYIYTHMYIWPTRCGGTRTTVAWNHDFMLKRIATVRVYNMCIMYVCVRMCRDICIYIERERYIHTHIHICISYIYIYIHTYIHIHM